MNKNLIIPIAFVVFIILQIFYFVFINQDNIKICPLLTKSKEKITSVEFTEISPLGIKGSVYEGILRLTNKENVLNINKNEHFQFNTASIFKNISVVIPQNAIFFASIRGKIFYSVKNKNQLEKTKAQNIIFFNNEKEAISAGYKRKKGKKLSKN